MKTPIALVLALLCSALASAADVAQPTVEARLAVSLALNQEYEKLVADAQELMNKELPAIKAEMESLYKPLTIGEDAGILQLADGRKFEHAVVTEIKTSSITIRSGRELASIPWNSLPGYFKVRAAHSVVAAANVDAVQAPVATAPAEPEGDRIYVGDINIRVVEQSDDYTTYSWTAKVGNPTEYGSKVNTKILLLDESGFQLDFGYGEALYVPAKSFRVLSGRTGVKKSIWMQMASYRVAID